MARDVLRFVDALGLRQIDLLGFSLGGYVAQDVALVRPAPDSQDCARRHRAQGCSAHPSLVR
jgi:pimeloyl-ACP methyl ester carboxylesterase